MLGKTGVRNWTISLTRVLESGQEDESESENEEFLNPNGTLVGTTENELFETDENGKKFKVSTLQLVSWFLPPSMGTGI